MTTLSAPPSIPLRRACMVTLAGYRFAVEVRYAREVVVFDEYTIVPLAPAHLLGVANLRGDVMPVVDIRPLLDMAPAAPGHQVRALVVERDGIKIGLMIDEVLGLEPLHGGASADEVDPPAPVALIARRLEREGGDVALLDVRALLTAMGGDTVAPTQAS